MKKSEISIEDKVIKRYIVTEDLFFLMNRWFQEHEEFKRFGVWGRKERSFFRKLSSCLRRDLQTLAFGGLTEDGQLKVDVEWKRPEDQDYLLRANQDRAFWIALDDVYVRNAQVYLGVTRIFDEDGLKIDIGSRPGPDGKYVSIDTRIAEIRDAYRDASSPPEVVLADDGAYEGSTAKKIIERLQREDIDIHVTHIKLAFCLDEGRDRLSKLERKEVAASKGYVRPIRFSCLDSQSKIGIHDWVCERDFYLGAPRSGRTLGSQTKPKTDPVPSKSRTSYPYIHGFGDIEGGANITRGRYELGARSIEYSIAMWSFVQDIVGRDRPILVRDLPRFPGPGGENAFSDCANEQAISYFEEVERRLYGSGRKHERKVKPLIVLPASLSVQTSGKASAATSGSARE